MSQRLQYELQRWHSQWVQVGESHQNETTLRQALQSHTEQLQAKVAELEADASVSAAIASEGLDSEWTATLNHVCTSLLQALP